MPCNEAKTSKNNSHNCLTIIQWWTPQQWDSPLKYELSYFIKNPNKL